MLLISPYLFVFIAKFGPAELRLNLPPVIFILLITVLIPNMIYAFVLKMHGETSTSLLFWDMILNLCNLPIFIMAFYLDSICSFFQ